MKELCVCYTHTQRMMSSNKPPCVHAPTCHAHLHMCDDAHANMLLTDTHARIKMTKENISGLVQGKPTLY